MTANKEPIHVRLSYPRSNDQPDTIEITLEAVRAATDLQIKYDFDRDGWVILSERLADPMHCDACLNEKVTFVEVAFVQSWALEYCAARFSSKD